MALENQIITVLRLSIGTLSTTEAKKKEKKRKKWLVGLSRVWIDWQGTNFDRLLRGLQTPRMLSSTSSKLLPTEPRVYRNKSL